MQSQFGAGSVGGVTRFNDDRSVINDGKRKKFDPFAPVKYDDSDGPTPPGGALTEKQKDDLLDSLPPTPPKKEATPQWEGEIKKNRSIGCRCCRRKNPDDDLIEHVEIHLDGFGKHGLTFVFSLMQFATMYTFCIFYYQYFTNTCNPSVYTLNKNNKYLDMLGLSFDSGLVMNLVFAIVSKFASIILLSLALDDYQQLNSNGTYLIFSIYTCLAPTCLLTPIYTYDHAKCMPKNFVINNHAAQSQCFLAVLVFLFPFIFSLLIPNTWSKVLCYPCLRRQAQKIEALGDE